MSLLVIICYDVSTETREGRRRLRRVARICEGIGQRVQKSVFECRVSLAQLEELERRLVAEIEPSEDCLRFYRLKEPVNLHVKEYGRFKAIDFEGALVI
ncbi:MAG: CRISPR-associated endonuclease Cas2 [Rhodocyclaceae bacterium]|nr:CRISPR-associated endonuclease Cas2 [Rhodocyclaceae bacterium]